MPVVGQGMEMMNQMGMMGQGMMGQGWNCLRYFFISHTFFAKEEWDMV